MVVKSLSTVVFIAVLLSMGAGVLYIYQETGGIKRGLYVSSVVQLDAEVSSDEESVQLSQYDGDMVEIEGCIRDNRSGRMVSVKDIERIGKDKYVLHVGTVNDDSTVSDEVQYNYYRVRLNRVETEDTVYVSHEGRDRYKIIDSGSSKENITGRESQNI